MLFAAVLESAIGPKRTFLFAPQMSAFGGKADIKKCPLITQSGSFQLRRSVSAFWGKTDVSGVSSVITQCGHATSGKVSFVGIKLFS